jgi:CelD/BcsL family acetyltransferase involved in cellulose biosynthesis
VNYSDRNLSLAEPTKHDEMNVGEWVEVRPIAEILATLDEQGLLDSLPFMPEMIGYCGTRFQIWKSAHKTCDPTGASDLRHLVDTVHGNSRCSGAAHGGCEAKCLLFWKKAWLKPVAGPKSGATDAGIDTFADISPILRGATPERGADGKVRYRCQVTELPRASSPLRSTQLSQYVDDVRSGNIGAGEAIPLLFSAAARALAFPLFQLFLKRKQSNATRAPELRQDSASLGLQPGEWVEVRSPEEIKQTLDGNWKNRGLVLEREMLDYCGQRFRVLSRVNRLIDEKSGILRELKNECIVLEGTYCRGLRNRTRLFCPRAPYYFWREAWLRRVDSSADTDELHGTVVSPTNVQECESVSPFAVETNSDFSAVESVWAELEPAGSAFQTRKWLTTWFETLAPGVRARPFYVTVRERKSGRPLVFFAFCVRRRWGFTVVEFPDLGVTDLNAPLCASDLALSDTQIEALWSEVRKAAPKADVFLFDKVPKTLNSRPMPITGLSWLEPMEMRCWAVKLPASRELYDTTLVRSKDRKEQRRKRRNLTERLGAPVLVEAGSGPQAEEIFETLKSMRATRFERQGRRDILGESKFAPFYEAITSDWRNFASLEKVVAGGKAIGAFLALRHANNYALIMHSFADDLENLSPGIVALDELISHLIRCKIDHCDFTIGDESYKRQFGVAECAMLQGVDPITAKGRLFRAVFNLERELRRELRKAFGEHAKAPGRLWKTAQFAKRRGRSKTSPIKAESAP